MSLDLFIGLYLADSLFCLWMLRWGGARWLEGWRAWVLIAWFAGHWSAEQIRLYVLLIWLFSTVFFIVGLIRPEYRF